MYRYHVYVYVYIYIYLLYYYYHYYYHSISYERCFEVPKKHGKIYGEFHESGYLQMDGF